MQTRCVVTCSRRAARFDSPTQAVLIDEAFHTMDYMRGTADRGPYYPAKGEPGADGLLSRASDASLRTEWKRGRFQYGFFIMFNGVPIHAVSKLHRCAADSTNWAEWIGMNAAMQLRLRMEISVFQKKIKTVLPSEKARAGPIRALYGPHWP